MEKRALINAWKSAARVCCKCGLPITMKDSFFIEETNMITGEKVWAPVHKSCDPSAKSVEELTQKVSLRNNPNLVKMESKYGPLAQLQPNRGLERDLIPPEAWEDDNNFVVEEKKDGNRFLMHITPGVNRFTSRHISKVTNLYAERTDNFPHLNSIPIPKQFAGTVLDGEIIMECAHPFIDTGSSKAIGTLTMTTSICTCSPDKAVNIQNKYGFVNYHVFDILFYKGEDLREKTFAERRQILEKVFEEVAFGPNVILTDQVRINKKAYHDLLVSQGKEGTMIKDLTKTYYDKKCMYKNKKEQTVDGWISEIIEGTEGKGFEGMAGSLAISCYDEEGSIREIVRVNIRDPKLVDETTLRLRKDMWENKEAYLGQVVEILAQDFTHHLRFRHGRINRWRPDKNKEDCVYDMSKMKNILRAANILY